MLIIFIFSVRKLGQQIWLFDIEAESLKDAKIKLEKIIRDAKEGKEEESYTVYDDDSQEPFEPFTLTA